MLLVLLAVQPRIRVRRPDQGPNGAALRMHFVVGDALSADGTLPVIYSPLSMSAGWEQLPRAYNRGYADEDALRLGVNVFMYLVTH